MDPRGFGLETSAIRLPCEVKLQMNRKESEMSEVSRRVHRWMDDVCAALAPVLPELSCLRGESICKTSVGAGAPFAVPLEEERLSANASSISRLLRGLVKGAEMSRHFRAGAGRRWATRGPASKP